MDGENCKVSSDGAGGAEEGGGEDEEQQPLPHLQRQAALAERVPVVW